MATIRLLYQLFGCSPGPVCELYVLLLQAYLLPGYASGRFDGEFARNRKKHSHSPIQVSTQVLKAIPVSLNALALLAFVRAEVDLFPAFPSGISSAIPRMLFTFADEHVMRMVLEALQDQAGKMRRGWMPRSSWRAERASRPDWSRPEAGGAARAENCCARGCRSHADDLHRLEAQLG